jgi:hypothetical protein
MLETKPYSPPPPAAGKVNTSGRHFRGQNEKVSRKKEPPRKRAEEKTFLG